MPEKLTWKAVFQIWLVMVPFVGLPGYVLAQQYPAQYQQCVKTAQAGWAWSQETVKTVQAMLPKKAPEGDKEAAKPRN